MSYISSMDLFNFLSFSFMHKRQILMQLVMAYWKCFTKVTWHLADYCCHLAKLKGTFKIQADNLVRARNIPGVLCQIANKRTLLKGGTCFHWLQAVRFSNLDVIIQLDSNPQARVVDEDTESRSLKVSLVSSHPRFRPRSLGTIELMHTHHS